MGLGSYLLHQFAQPHGRLGGFFATLEKLLQVGGASFVAGLDPSTEAVRGAEARLRNWIDAGRLEIQLGSVESIPWPAASFDRLLSVNSIYYWPDPARGVAEMYRVLRPGGTAVIALRAKAVVDKLGLEKHGYRSLGEQEVGNLLEQAGFSSVDWQTQEDQPRGGVVLVVAQK